ncbi:MAG: ABC transporter permease [Thermoanaerobaculia bacterium]
MIRLALRALAAHRLRSALSASGVAIGIASVILLTSIGEGTRRYMVSEFSQFGTNLMAVTPGKSETLGLPGVLGGSTHKLTLDDGLAVARLPGVEAVMPVVYGTARVEHGGRGRHVYVYGVTPDATAVWRWNVRVGRFWRQGDVRRASPEAVLGPTLQRELFAARPALGEMVRIGGRRFRVVGIMEPKGQFLGFDLDDAAYVPVAAAMQLFDTDELSELDITVSRAAEIDRVAREVERKIAERHDGRVDFTVTTQDQMLEVFGNVMNIITMAVGAIGGVSLVVGAVGILTMMWIAVGERTREIGLIRAVGGARHQVLVLFLAESAAVSMAGGLAGLGIGTGLCALLRLAVRGLPVHTPPLYVALALLVSLATGLVAGVLPARRAATVDPAEALRAE